MNKKIKNRLLSFMLLGITIVVCLIVAELALRFLYPKYEYAAESSFNQSESRIWSRKANSSEVRSHPDTGKEHKIIHNNFALRQHRNFKTDDLKNDINIAFFGDSFTENLRISSQYSFTEPLDYLLNLGGNKFNVLNFGVDGYGTDQCYLYYNDFEYSENLNFVFYVFSLNDIRNIYENNLFTLDENGTLIQHKSNDPSFVKKIIGKFHLTYLFIDLWNRLALSSETDEVKLNDDNIEEHSKRFHSPKAEALQKNILSGIKDSDLDNYIKIFNTLLHVWKGEVEKNGGRFVIILLPRVEENSALKIFDKDFEILNLYSVLNKSITNYSYEDIRFKTDAHWNEAGNFLAALNIYKFLAEKEGADIKSYDEIISELRKYYSSFNEDWFPENFIDKKNIEYKSNNAIRKKYLQLELK